MPIQLHDKGMQYDVTKMSKVSRGLILHGMEAAKAVASMPPGHCLGALKMLQ